jgi:phage virion morphogenesis protein
MTISVDLDEGALHEIVQNAINDGLLRVIGETVLTTIQERFLADEPTAPDGVPWKKLSDTTLAMRRSHGDGSEKILRDTGRLLDSLTFQVVENKVNVGTAVEYASKHNMGFGWQYPKRQFIGKLNENDIEEVRKSIKEFFE